MNLPLTLLCIEVNSQEQHKIVSLILQSYGCSWGFNITMHPSRWSKFIVIFNYNREILTYVKETYSCICNC